MKTILLLVSVLILGSSVMAQRHITKECTDECVYGIRSQLQQCFDYTEPDRECESVKKGNVGFLKYGEVISTDTTDDKGRFILPIPEYAETDIYSVKFYHVYHSRYDSTDTDTLVWDCIGCYGFSPQVVCLKHGSKEEVVMPLRESDVPVTAQLFPVPAIDQLTIRFSSTFSGSVSLISITGSKVISQKIIQQESQLIDVSQLSGVYVVEVTDASGRQVQLTKVIIL